MSERVRVTTTHGLRLRDSPRDGAVLDIIPQNAELEVLGRETWLRVNFGSTTGFVLADFVEPEDSTPFAADSPAQIVEVTHPLLKGEVLRADVVFKDRILSMLHAVEEDKDLNFSMWITSSLREPYKPVVGAVVDPAEFSNHHVGHALDMNILRDGRLYRSTEMATGQLPSKVQAFLDNGIGQFGLIWGAKLKPQDFVHIDDRLNILNKTAFKQKLAALWGDPQALA
jgi:hypothetical protein